MSGKRIVARVATGFSLVAILSCGDSATAPPPTAPPPAPRPTTVSVSPSTAELTAAGATVQLAAEVRDQNGQLVAGDTLRLAAEAFDENGYAVARESFTWSSSDVSVASVDGSGLVRGASEGKATITAAGGDVSGAATVTVAHGNSATWTASKPSISPRMS